MKLAIMQPYLFPYLGYFQLLAAVDRFVVYDDVSYIKGGWINRNRIRVGNEARYFTLPPLGASPNRKICEIGLGDVARWRKKFLRSLEQEYARAPHFEATFALVEDACSLSSENLAEFVRNSIVRVCQALRLGAEIVPTSRCYHNDHLRGPERVLDICARENAEVYVNPIGGAALYDRDAFRRRGVELRFLEPKLVEYDQGGRAFLPGLSIIDVMMWNSPAETAGLLRDYVLV